MSTQRDPLTGTPPVDRDGQGAAPVPVPADPPALRDDALAAAMPMLVDPPGEWITQPSGERIFMIDPSALAAMTPSPATPTTTSADAPGDASMAAMPMLGNPPGEWITQPSGERIFMIDPAALAAMTPSPATPTTSAGMPVPSPTPSPATTASPPVPPSTPFPVAAGNAPAAPAMPVLVDPPGEWVTQPSGERIFMLDAAAMATPEAAKAAAASLPVLMDPPGSWVTLPSGERIFMLDTAAQPASSEAGTPAWASPRGGFAPSPAADRIFVPGARQRAEPSPAGTAAGGSDDADGAGDEGAGFEVQSEGLSEIVSLVPGRLARTGIGVICGVFAVLLALASAVRYPQVVTGAATVTTPDPPVRVAAALGGAIDRVLVADNQQVRAGQVLAALESSADYGDVAALDAALARSRAGDPVALPAARALGDVQQAHAEYVDAREQYLAFVNDPWYAPRIAALRAQVAGQENLRTSMQARLRLLEEDAALAERDVQRSRELVRRQYLSAQEGERSDAAYLAKRQALAAGRDEASSQALRASDLATQIMDQEQRHHADEVRLRLAMEKSFAALREAVRLWQVRYLLRAPRDGRVSFFRTLAEGQYASPGEALLAVVPGGGRATATVLIANAGAGRVRPGQAVLLRFDGYPHQEFGTVEGRVEHVSLVADQGSAQDHGAGPRYRVTVSLPRGLRTSYGRRLELRQEMSGSADVVTDDATVLQRLFEQFRGRPNEGA